MSDCKHKNYTADCVCNDCGYDLIVDAMAEKHAAREHKRIRSLLGEFGMKLEKEVSDGDNYSLGRYNAISEFIAILDGELHE
jgi:hypothetical protein